MKTGTSTVEQFRTDFCRRIPIWMPDLLQARLERCSIFGEPILINELSARANPLNAIFSSLTAFLAAGARPRTPLAKAIVLVLVIKLIGIAGIKVFMFPDSTQPVVDATAMARVMGPPASLP